MPDFDVSVNYFLLSSPFFLSLNIFFYLPVILILCLHCYTIKKVENHSVGKGKNLYGIYKRKTLLQVLGLWIFPNFRYLSKYFVQVFRAQLMERPCW